MDCPRPEFEDSDFFRAFFRRAETERVPLAGTLELTRQCNLACVHCYLGPQSSVRAESRPEMTTAQVRRILDQLVEAGCLALIMTGGDPLLRPDFEVIYRTAKLAGLDVTVYTNGTAVTPGLVDLFQDLPPRAVEITVHSASESLFDRVTRVRGSFRRCMQGVRMLHDGEVRLTLKMMLMTVNRNELAAVRALAESMGARFRFDPLVNARLDGDSEPLQYRVDAAEAVQAEFHDADVRRSWRRLYQSQPLLREPERLLQCGAGETQFHVDAFGRLNPCLMLPGTSYDLLSGTLAEGWARMARVRELLLDPGNPCVTCHSRVYCGYCPGLLELESGNEGLPSAYLCALGKERMLRLAATSREEA